MGTLRRYVRIIRDVAQLALCTSKAPALLKRLALASPFREALRTRWKRLIRSQRGARGALRVGFQPTRRMATALERARRDVFVSVTELRPAEEERSSARTRHEGDARSSTLLPVNTIVIAARGDQVLRERIGASED